jgi:hypothetical protein
MVRMMDVEENAPSRAESLPSVVVLDGVLVLSFRLEVRRLDPLKSRWYNTRSAGEKDSLKG